VYPCYQGHRCFILYPLPRSPLFRCVTLLPRSPLFRCVPLAKVTFI
jgi:hypothetical protein